MKKIEMVHILERAAFIVCVTINLIAITYTGFSSKGFLYSILFPWIGVQFISLVFLNVYLEDRKRNIGFDSKKFIENFRISMKQNREESNKRIEKMVSDMKKNQEIISQRLKISMKPIDEMIEKIRERRI